MKGNSKGIYKKQNHQLVGNSLHDLGVYFDEQGLLRNKKTGDYVTLANIPGDAQSLVTAITYYVFVLFLFMME